MKANRESLSSAPAHTRLPRSWYWPATLFLSEPELVIITTMARRRFLVPARIMFTMAAVLCSCTSSSRLMCGRGPDWLCSSEPIERKKLLVLG
ncbi:hypothetical protein D9M68_775240 [compost metagenome]